MIVTVLIEKSVAVKPVVTPTSALEIRVCEGKPTSPAVPLRPIEVPLTIAKSNTIPDTKESEPEMEPKLDRRELKPRTIETIAVS